MAKIVTAFCLLLALMITPLRAAEIAADDQKAMSAIITQQLQAFAANRDADAYGYAAPIVKFAFPTIESFMGMVKQGYQPVYRNNGYRFAESFFDPAGRPAQKVIIDAADGKTYEAVYFMEQQPDGSWRIAGCVIRVLADLNA
ncbi:MAG: DUF4864 domain-containing protein [Proteobacteria bacterium]|nr:DUF4864 domain-containing protein [Pseudomonadota bacterium]